MALIYIQSRTLRGISFSALLGYLSRGTHFLKSDDRCHGIKEGGERERGGVGVKQGGEGEREGVRGDVLPATPDWDAFCSFGY